MSQFRVLCLAVLSCLLLVQCGPQIATSNQSARYTTGTNKVVSSANAAALNALRAGHGLPALQTDPTLARMAAAHARDMQKNGFFGHVSVNGDTIRERAVAQGYNFCHVAENLAKGQTHFDTVLQQWMTSPSHRANLLKTDVVEFGLVHGAGDLWVLVLGQRGC